MPVMDGIELIRRLRQDPKYRGLRLLMISTENDSHRIATALEAGADDYLTKPFTPAALTRKLVALGVCREAVAGGPAQRPIGVLICDDSADHPVACSPPRSGPIPTSASPGPP